NSFVSVGTALIARRAFGAFVLKPTLPFASMMKAVEVEVGEEVETTKRGIRCVDVPAIDNVPHGLEVLKPNLLSYV
ncbi:hypothetical protein, partial [Bifidobacterium pullorum]|uniref:hypothetical protein n=1 Tax=Bifidobacterium pullorum TaxID=78448 RepID=UPI0019579946